MHFHGTSVLETICPKFLGKIVPKILLSVHGRYLMMNFFISAIFVPKILFPCGTSIGYFDFPPHHFSLIMIETSFNHDQTKQVLIMFHAMHYLRSVNKFHSETCFIRVQTKHVSCTCEH